MGASSQEMRVAVLYNEAAEDSAVDERDILMQRDSVCAALGRLGHETISVGCTLNLASLQQQLKKLEPSVVFNLVESLGGTDRLMHLAPSLLDALAIPYTGVRTESMYATTSKLLVKERCRDAGLPTPGWWPGEMNGQEQGPPEFSLQKWERAIIKPVWEHASVGMDDAAVIPCVSIADLERAVTCREADTGRPHFAEQFIDGREFNLSLICAERRRESANRHDVEVLPAAEIAFLSFPPGKPKIVGHRAKWDEGSFEHENTKRQFEMSASDGTLLDKLTGLARRCWETFGLRGYARVDFRVDEDGNPWILELNANPCISTDAGFAAATIQAGIGYDRAIDRILQDAFF